MPVVVVIYWTVFGNRSAGIVFSVNLSGFGGDRNLFAAGRVPTAGKVRFAAFFAAAVRPDDPYTGLVAAKGPFLPVTFEIVFFSIRRHLNIPILPKEFPAYRDTFHASVFPEIAKAISNDIMRYARIYSIDVLLAETPETTEFLKHWNDNDQEKIEFTDLITLISTEG